MPSSTPSLGRTNERIKDMFLGRHFFFLFSKVEVGSSKCLDLSVVH